MKRSPKTIQNRGIQDSISKCHQQSSNSVTTVGKLTVNQQDESSFHIIYLMQISVISEIELQ